MSHQSGAGKPKYRAARMCKFRGKLTLKGRSIHPTGGSYSAENMRKIEQMASELSESKANLMKFINVEWEAYKQSLKGLMKDDEYKKGFPYEEEWSCCVQYYENILNGITADDLIKAYCTSNDESIKNIKEEFKSKGTKDELRDTKSYGFRWPKYHSKVEYRNEKKNRTSIIREKGNHYDIHHIIPKAFGGDNSNDNIIPMHALDHFDKKGIHIPGGLLNHLAKDLKDYKRDYWGKTL